MWGRRLTRRNAVKQIGLTTSAFAGAWAFGCGGDDDDTTTPATSPTPTTSASNGGDTPKRGGTLRVALSGDPTGLDPSVSRGGNDHHWLYSIFDNLVNNDPTFQVAPGIAHSWEVVDDLTIVFKVDDGFTFQDGSPFSAEDIKYTIDRHKDPATKSYAAGQVGSIERVEVTDPTTVTFHLNEVTASLFSILGDRAGMIIPQAAAESAGENFTNKPIGSGPMKLERWAVDASMEFSRFDGFRREGYPYLDGLDIQIIPNSSVQFANLRTGNADLILVNPKDVEAAKRDSSIQFVEKPGIGFSQINLNISQAPLTDTRVRQAMTYSLNREAILQAIMFGVGRLSNGPMSSATWAYNENLKPIEEDLKRAKELLSAAGHENGVTFDFLITPTEENVPLAEMLKGQWARVGINVNIVSRSAEEAGAEYRAQKFPMLLTGFSGRADPDLTIFENWHSKGGFNRASFNDQWAPDPDQQKLDEKIEKARQIYDQEERKALYDEIQRQIVEEARGIFFTERSNLYGMGSKVRGLTPYGDGKLRLHELWLDA